MSQGSSSSVGVPASATSKRQRIVPAKDDSVSEEEDEDQDVVAEELEDLLDG